MSDMGTNVDVAANIEMNASGNLGTAVQEVAMYTDKLTELIAKYERWLNLQAKAAASGKDTSYYDSRINNLAQEIARKTAEAEAAEKKLQVRLTELNKAQKTTKNMNFGREVERRESLTPSQIALNEARTERYKYLSEEADRVKRNRDLNRKLQYADNMGKILGGFKDPTGMINGAGGAVSTAANFVKTLMGPMGKVGAVGELAAKGLQKLYNASQEAFQSVEVIKTSLSVITGSDTSGEALFRNISEFAVKSPFGVQQTSEQATLLRQSGVYNIDLMDKLKEIGDLAGGNSERMQRISNDYAQIMANGKATAIQLRQLGMAGIPIYKELSKELGVGTAEVRQMSKNGEISSEVIDRVFKNLTSEGGTFYQSVEKGSKTIKARTTNLEDAKTLAFAELGEWFNKWGTGEDNKTNLSALIGLEEAIYNLLNDWLGKINNNLDYNNLLKNQRAIEEAEVSVKSLEKRKERGEFVDFELEYERERLAKLKDAYTDDQKISIEYARFSDLFKPLIEKEEKREALGRRLDEYNAKHRALNEKLESEEDLDNWYELDKQAINLGLAIDSLSNEFEGLGSDIETLKENLTSDLQRAGFLVNFNNLQENSAEYLEKAASKSGSLGDFTSKMEALYKQTDKYKKEQEELQKKNFEHTKEMARILSGKLDDEGFLNVNKISSASEFRELMSLMSSENKLDPKNRKDFEEINRRIDTAVRLAESDTTINKGNKEYIDLMNQLSGLKGLEGNALYNAFNRFSEAIKNISDGSTAELFNQIVGPLLTYRISGNTKALDFDLSDLDKGKTIEPLWKRILGNGLGLDPSKITSGVGALQTHETEQYTRNVSKSVLQSALRGGADTTQMMAMLSRTGQYKTDKYDPTRERVQQIDWKTTSKNLKEFALRLGQAAEVTSAYRQSVEDEVNTLADLLASMPTTFEDAANADNFKEQFLNVYKGSLKMGDKEVNIDADGNVRDMNGKPLGAAKDLIDQLEINEKTIKEANEQLKQRRKDLLEARKAETANSLRADALGNLDKNAISIALSSLGIESGSYLESILSKEAEIVVNEFKGSDDYKNLIGGNVVKEVLAKAVLADTKQYEEELAAAQKKVDEAQKTVNDFFFGTLTKMYEGEKGVNKNEIDEWLKETSKEDSERGRKIKNALDEYGKLIKTRDDYKSEKASVTRRDDNVKAEEEKAKKNSAKVLDSASEFNLILEKLLDVMKEYLNEDSEKISDLLEASNARIAYQEEYNRIATLGKMSVAERKMMAGGSLHQGNVDLLNRPKVSDKDMWAAGYLDFEKGATATLYSSSLSNENGFTITYTPILPNGTVLDEKSVEAYIQNILDGGNLTKEDVLKADSLGIVLGVHNSEQEASRFGYALHNNQADYFGMNTPSYFRERQLDYMYGMDSSTYNQFQSNQMASLKSRMFGNNGEFLAGGKPLKEQLSKALGKDFAEEYTSLLKDESLDPSEWSDRFRDMNEQLAKFQLGLNSIKEISKELNDSFSSMFDSFAWDVVTGGLETIGQSMTEMLAGVNDGTDAWKNFGQSFVQMTKSLLSNMGPMLMQAGLKMIIDSQNKGERWMGIALLAAGGLSSIMAGALGATSDDNSDSDKEKKLERLRDDLKDLLAQAKADAQYYEQNVSHQKALSVNGAYARNQKVNDAIITPNGNVISTHPDDYLIATKNPQGLMGNGKQTVTFSPSIVVNNNTGRALKVEPKYDENTGDINFTIEEMVVGIVNKGLAEGSFESGMGAREQSLRGRKVYA